MTAAAVPEGRPGALDSSAAIIRIRIDQATRRLLSGAAPVLVEVTSASPPRATTRPGGLDRTADPEVADFVAEVAGADPTGEPLPPIAIQCALLERFQIRQGTKAIAVFMFKHWTPDLAAKHGPAVNPNTLRRWRVDFRRRHGCVEPSVVSP